MIGKQAKAFSRRDIEALLKAAHRSRTPLRDRVIVLLAVRAGLRAGEIAKLTWGMVLDAQGQIASVVEVSKHIAKRGSGRRVPMHAELGRALQAWKNAQPAAKVTHDAIVVPSLRGGPMRANSIVNWFVTHCREAGLAGCSSHSGRRTFITNAARQAHRAGASLKDVQVLAGHRSLETTQLYIDGDSDAQRRLVGLL